MSSRTFFYVVSTPVGNLEDLSFRALRVLSEVDLILCEDTRITKKLLEHYKIKIPTLSYHQHSRLEKVNYILNLLKEGKNLAMVSDAGTPGISDPGSKLIKQIVDSLADLVKIVPIPGLSAFLAGLSVSGFPIDRFLFLGFLPAKKKRRKFFEEIAVSKYPIVIYESPHRILKTLKELKSFAGSREIIVCRELTKKFEEILRGKISDVLEKLEKTEIKGEFTIVVNSR